MSKSPLEFHCSAPGWDTRTLKEVSELIKDGTHGTHERVSFGIPLLSAKNISPFGEITIDDEDSLISEDEYKKIHSKYELIREDLLLTVVGTLGRRAIVSGNRKYSIQRSIGVIRCNKLQVAPNFLYHFMGADYFQNQLVLRSNATAQAGVYLGELAKIEVPCPPIPEQNKIATILSSVDNVIEKTRAQIDKLMDLKTGMMQQLLTKGIGHTEFKDSPVGRIPVGWDAVLLDRIAKRGSGHTPSKSKSEYWNGGVHWVSLSDTSKLDQLYISSTAKQISVLGLQNSSAVIHPAGTVILSRDAGIGKSGIITKNMAVSQHFMAWQCSDKLDSHYLYYILQLWKPKFEAIAMGSTIKTIGLSYFKQLLIPVPHKEEQSIIAETLKSVDLRIFALERKKASLESLKKSLMQDLLTGTVRVNVHKKETGAA